MLVMTIWATLRSGCKVTFFLRITGLLPGGWHALDTLFLPLDEPHDTLHILKNDSVEGCFLHCAQADIDPENNTLTKAWRLFAEASGWKPGMTIELEKGVPSGAGLGGGSADAAALLHWLNATAPRPLSLADLCSLAARVGADVPFFLYKTPCHATGIGERLEPCVLPEFLRGTVLLLVCPPISVSTPWACGAWDACQKSGVNLLTESRYRRRESHSRKLEGEDTFWVTLENSFEQPVFAEYPRLLQIKTELLRLGARGAVMSGSGSSLFGLFRTWEEAESASGQLREQGMAAYCHLL